MNKKLACYQFTLECLTGFWLGKEQISSHTFNSPNEIAFFFLSSSQVSLGQLRWMSSSKMPITDLFELWMMRFLFLQVNSAASSEVGHLSCLPKFLFSSITVKQSSQGVLSSKIMSFKLRQSNFLALPSAHRIFSQPALILHPYLDTYLSPLDVQHILRRRQCEIFFFVCKLII